MIELLVFIGGFAIGVCMTGFISFTAIEYYKAEVKNATRVQ